MTEELGKCCESMRLAHAAVVQSHGDDVMRQLSATTVEFMHKMMVWLKGENDRFACYQAGAMAMVGARSAGSARSAMECRVVQDLASVNGDKGKLRQ